MDEKQIVELKRELFYLGAHIRLLTQWARRGDTNPGLATQAQLVQQKFEEIAKILPPAVL